MIDPAKLSGRAFRRYVSEVLVTDSDLNAFCLDYYPEIYRQFSGGMTRDAKLDLLLAKGDAVQIYMHLKEAEPNRSRRFEHMLKLESNEPANTPPKVDSEPPRELSREEILDALCMLSLPAFEEVEFRMDLNRAQAASTHLSQTQRAIALIRQAEQDRNAGLKKLSATIAKVRR